MLIADISFYVFSSVMVIAGFFTVMARNPVHSVLWLILSFFAASGLFILLGAEFLAMLLLIVYVGAVAVLFLFVVMMLDVDFSELRAKITRYIPFALAIGVLLIMELFIAFGSWPKDDGEKGTLLVGVRSFEQGESNTQALGEVLYTDYILSFQLAGLVLLVAMIGAIVLTLRHRPDVKRQDIPEQILRDPVQSVELKDVESGRGLL